MNNGRGSLRGGRRRRFAAAEVSHQMSTNNKRNLDFLKESIRGVQGRNNIFRIRFNVQDTNRSVSLW